MKKFIQLLALILVFCTNQLPAQVWQWAHTVNVPVSAAHNVLEPDDQGNFYLAVNSGVGTCLIKYNSAGNELWRKCFSGLITTRGVAANSTDVFVTGHFFDTVPVFTTAITSAGKSDGFLMRISASGSFSWVKTMGGPENDMGGDVVIDKTMNLQLTGTYADTAAIGQTVMTCTCTSAMFVARFDMSGSLLSHTGSDCLFSTTSFATGSQIMVDHNKNTYVLGHFNYFQLDSIQVTGGGGPYDPYYLAKFDSAGKALWAHKTIEHTIQELFELAMDSSGHLLVNGYSHWTNGGNTTTAKIDPANGNVLWTSFSSSQCSGDQGISQGVTTEGTDSYIFGRVSLGTNCTPGRQKLLLVKYNSAGGTDFYDTIPLPMSAYNFDITRILPDAFVVTGIMSPGTLTLGTHTMTAYTNDELFVARFNDVQLISGIQNRQETVKVRAFPNPTSGTLNIEGEDISGVEIYNVIGTQVMTGSGTKNGQIDLSAQPDGIYFIKFMADGVQRTVKIIKE